MSKLNQKIVLYIEGSRNAWGNPSKIGNLFMNRFAIDEDAINEILKIYQLENLYLDDFIDDDSSDDDSYEEGLDLIN